MSLHSLASFRARYDNIAGKTLHKTIEKFEVQKNNCIAAQAGRTPSDNFLPTQKRSLMVDGRVHT
jgi:hypothetical protein